MKEDVKYIKSWRDVNYINEAPDKCPICNKHCIPIPVLEYKNKEASIYSYMTFVCICPNSDCNNLFLAHYRAENSVRYKKYYLRHLSPYIYEPREFDDEIHNISPNFVEIYNQSEEAERRKLNQICGAGYRKSLEFLIKDYSILNHPNEEEKIKKLPLAQCISKYLNEQNLIACANRATWLGNDETHYTRIWKDKDIEDFKLLIKMTLNWILLKANTDKYEKAMKKKEYPKDRF